MIYPGEGKKGQPKAGDYVLAAERVSEAHSPAGERHGGRASRGRGRHGNEEPGGATAGDDRK
jgi:hypothetical protein